MAKNDKRQGINTQLAHAGHDPHGYFGFVNPPVVHASTVLYPDANTLSTRGQKYTYGTRGTPTTDALAEAIDALEQSMDEAADQMSQSIQQMLMAAGMGRGGSPGEGTDPLGRGEQDEGGASADVKIPDEMERRRVQQIIQDLRARENDYQRPKTERDYIDRLLDQFN